MEKSNNLARNETKPGKLPKFKTIKPIIKVSPPYQNFKIYLAVVVVIIPIIIIILFTKRENETDNDNYFSTTITPLGNRSNSTSFVPQKTRKPLPNLDNGAIFNCKDDPFTSFYQFNKNTGKRHYLLNQTIANSCNAKASSMATAEPIDCGGIPNGQAIIGNCPNNNNNTFYSILEPGATVKCKYITHPMWYFNGNTLIHLQDPNIANSCASDWRINNYLVSCSGLDSYQLGSNCQTQRPSLKPGDPGVKPDLSLTFPPLQNGSLIQCENDSFTDNDLPSSKAVYQYRNGVKYWLPTNQIRSSCYSTLAPSVLTVNCSSLKSGPQILGNCPTLAPGQSYFPVLEDGNTVVCEGLPNVFWQYNNDKNIFHYPNDEIGNSCKQNFKSNSLMIDCSGLQRFKVDSPCVSQTEILNPFSSNVTEI